MPEDWAQTVAKKVENRLAEETERAAVQRKRFEDGVERFRKQLLSLVSQVNAHIETEAHRIHTIVIDNGIILVAAYKRVVTEERAGAEPGVPACVGKIVVERENRRATTQAELAEVYITAAGTQVAFYHRAGPAKDLKQFSDGDYKPFIEFFAS